MKLLLRFLFTLSFVFLGSAQRSGAQMYAGTGIRIYEEQAADHTRVFHSVDRLNTTVKGRSLDAPRAQDELATSDNENEDDREDEERQLTAKQLPPPHFFRSWFADFSASSDADSVSLTQVQSLQARCVAPSATVLFQIFRI